MIRVQFAWTRRVIGAATLAGMAVVTLPAADSAPKGRTSPVGYEDTPVLPGQKWRVHDLKRPHPPKEIGRAHV